MGIAVLGDLAIGELDTFLEVFSTEGKDKRAEHGCQGAEVFAPAGQTGRVLVLLRFPDVAAFESFRSHPEAPPIMRKGGAQGPPTFTVLDEAATFDA